MNAEELWRWIGEHTSPDMEVHVEAGGDGAIHSSPVNSIWVDETGNRVVISGEAG